MDARADDDRDEKRGANCFGDDLASECCRHQRLAAAGRGGPHPQQRSALGSVVRSRAVTTVVDDRGALTEASSLSARTV